MQNTGAKKLIIESVSIVQRVLWNISVHSFYKKKDLVRGRQSFNSKKTTKISA